MKAKSYIKARQLIKTKNLVRKALPILLCAFMVFAFMACSDSSDENTVAGIEYYHYNTTDFNAKCDKLEKMAGGDAVTDTGTDTTATDDSEKVLKLYDKLYGECEEMDTLYSVIYVQYSTNMANKHYSKEQRYAYNILVKSTDRLCGICRDITESPYADTFREHVGEDAFGKFSKYEVMTKEEKKLVRQEKKLVDEYYDVIEKVESDGYTYKNKKWTLDDIMGEGGDELAVTDYNGYLKIYDGIQKKANEAAGPIFIELVGIRDKMADLAGFDSYADYSDTHEYNRDYTAEDLEAFHTDVKKVSSNYYENYYASAMAGVENTLPEMSERKLLRELEKYSGKIDKTAGNACEVLLNEKLYDIGDAEYRQDGAFTTYIEKANKPFISMTLDHNRDFLVLTHEFGHFVEYSVEGTDDRTRNILTDEDNIDLAEIASNGYEGLMTHYYPEIFGKSKADSATKYIVEDLLENVIEGCVFDEFQREIYENPDMTLEEVNQTFAKIDSEYNESADEDDGYYWVFVNHNFEMPMYYISYAVSGLVALQIWDMSQDNFDAATRTWEKVIKEGSFNKGYLEVLKKCNLELFTDVGVVESVCKPAIKVTQPELSYDFEM